MKLKRNSITLIYKEMYERIDYQKKQKTNNMKQQTAIEWLKGMLEWNYGEQAKQMEKEQIVNAFEIGWKDEDRIGEEYYNETFTSTPQT